MANVAPKPPERSPPKTPTLEAWQAMTPEQRDAAVLAILDRLSDPRDAMSEGRPHQKAKSRAIDMLGLHFGAIGRVIYLAEELAVLYPGEDAFVPDILAVADVVQPEDDPRMAWIVMDEKRGLDFVLEVLHGGDRRKDLVDNVERYARLGIPEYFVYDRREQRVHGHRLPAGADRYERVIPQGGRYHSAVLGLDLAVERDGLRFFHGMAELFGSADLIDRMKRIVESLESKAAHAEERAEAEAERAEAERERGRSGLRGALLAVLEARGIPCPEEARSRVLACQDATTLERWLVRAATATVAEEMFALARGPLEICIFSPQRARSRVGFALVVSSGPSK